MSRKALKTSSGPSFKLIAYVGLFIFVLPVGGYFLSNAFGNICSSFWTGIMLRSQMTLQKVTLEGQHHTSLESVALIVAPYKGSPLGCVSFENLARELHQLPWVRHASLERRWPNHIHIAFEEYEPFARWQVGGSVRLIAKDGVAFTPQDMDEYVHLPYFLGEGANLNATFLLEILKAYPNVEKSLGAASFIGKRRWNLILKDNITVKLPEEGIKKALAKLEQLLNDHDFMEKTPKTIDLRLENKVFIKMNKEDNKNKLKEVK